MIYANFGKRALDIVASAAIIVIFSPILIGLAAGARISSPGPAIFRQQRIGRNGRVFVLIKFRTMPTNTGDVSSDRLGSVSIRPYGRLLRRTNLDELPQLFNILRGDMSLVGPRPPLATQTALIDLRRTNGSLACRPGLTGLAQICSFDGMSILQKASLDGRYAARISFRQDAMIVVRTFGYLLRPPPVY